MTEPPADPAAAAVARAVAALRAWYRAQPECPFATDAGVRWMVRGVAYPRPTGPDRDGWRIVGEVWDHAASANGYVLVDAAGAERTDWTDAIPPRRSDRAALAGAGVAVDDANGRVAVPGGRVWFRTLRDGDPIGRACAGCVGAAINGGDRRGGWSSRPLSWGEAIACQLSGDPIR